MTELTNAMLAVARSLPADSTMIVPASWVLSLAHAAPSQSETPASAGATSASSPFLTVADAAARLNVKPKYLYRHRATLPFLYRVGSRTLRVDAAKLEKWLARRPV